jgi:hypothetical protein
MSYAYEKGDAVRWLTLTSAVPAVYVGFYKFDGYDNYHWISLNGTQVAVPACDLKPIEGENT